jgi:cytochrome c biogenesis protein
MASSRRSSSDSARPDDAPDAELEPTQTDPRRPSDHFDSPAPQKGIVQPTLGLVGYLRFFWRQLTSMRTALFLLLLVAFAAVPGSLVPQVTSDPNGVIQYKEANPGWSKVLDALGVFNTYSSVWFSAIYLLLFISLVGCIIPRTMHHISALRAAPPKTPARLDRLPGYVSTDSAPAEVDVEKAIQDARGILKRLGYRVRVFPGESVSAERGYLRETGNLIFHIALVGILLAVGVGGGFIYTGQKVVVVGQSFANTGSDYDSLSPGRWFSADALSPYVLQLTKFTAVYETQNQSALGEPIDYTANVRTKVPGGSWQNQTIKVNSPLRVGDTDVYLLGNGYAPTLTVRNPAGKVVLTQSIPFLAQDANLTSTGVLRVPFGLKKQLGMIGLFLPTTCADLCTSSLSSLYPGLTNPELSLQVYEGDLGFGKSAPINAFTLDTTSLKEIAGRNSGKPGLILTPGKTVALPNGLGTITLEKNIPRYVSLDIHHDPTQLWVLSFAILVFLGLVTGLFIPRRRMWVKAVRAKDGVTFEYAGLARGEDGRLDEAVAALAQKHSQLLGLSIKP